MKHENLLNTNGTRFCYHSTQYKYYANGAVTKFHNAYNIVLCTTHESTITRSVIQLDVFIIIGENEHDTLDNAFYEMTKEIDNKHRHTDNDPCRHYRGTCRTVNNNCFTMSELVPHWKSLYDKYIVYTE